ncbi:LVIVD repeat-containing protein [uncultured Hymenobacter sp.]|uniref:LVIVD repeat-containing protein n=1 Tax=uncultured Hymenobacter sp. TaxID=170016 RepID=UPI0035CA80BE
MLRTRLLPYLLSLLLLPALLACADHDEAQPSIGYYDAYAPRLMARATLEASVAALPPQPMRQTGKIYVRGPYLFINEQYEGIHVIDNRNPALPHPVSFLRIPGNIDLAVKGNLLYADNGPDLVAIDISNPEAVKVSGRVRDAFRELPAPAWQPVTDAGQPANRPLNTVVVGWQKVQVAYDRQQYGGWGCFDRGGVFLANATSPSLAAAFSVAPAGATGKAGSMARFAVLGDNLYAVDDQSLRLFDLRTPAQPIAGAKLPLQFGVETIFPKDHYLFLGTQRGMYIFDVAQPQAPAQVAYYQHVVSCDPVVVDDRYAYVTLRNGRACGGGPNELQVIDLTTLSQPRLARSYPLTGPQGLGVDGNRLFVCDANGLKVFDTSQAPLLTPQQSFPVKVVDVIPDGGTLLAIGAEGLY